METSTHDVLLVGGGGAGLRAAIAVAEANPGLSVAVVSKVYPMRSHTVSAEGGAAAVIKANDSLEDHAYDTISGADWLADQDAVEAFVEEAPGIRRIGGRRLVHPYLEGASIGNTTPVIYCKNDLGGAWERDGLGNWVSPCTPGGEEQRKDAFHLGINLILYAMTGNYKEDLIHVPFIRKRLTW